MLKKIILSVMLLALCGCPGGCPDTIRKEGDKPTSPVATNVPTPEKTISPSEQNIETLKIKLEESDKKAAEAAAKGETIAKLSAEKDSLGLRVQLAEAYAKEWKENAQIYSEQRDSKEQELKEAKLDAWKTKLWWMAGICGLLAMVAGGVAFGFPLLRSVAVKAAIILGAISGIMLFVAQALGTIAWLLGLVPYIIAIGGLAALVYGTVAFRHWYKDHNGLKQTIEGIEPIKDKIEGFGDHMLKYVDGVMVNHVKSYKKKIKAVAEKAAATINPK